MECKQKTQELLLPEKEEQQKLIAFHYVSSSSQTLSHSGQDIP